MTKVTICITTYNLEKYISKALDSVLMQKTTFDYKIIVADDCSTDGTIEILKKYAKEYPSIVELITSDQNEGSLHNSNRIFDVYKVNTFHFWMGMIIGSMKIDFKSKSNFWISIESILCVEVILNI